VMGQFSKFIRPGSRIFKVRDTNSLAAYNPANSSLVLVAVNDSSNGISMTYDLSAFGALPSQCAVYRTSATESLAALPPLQLSGHQFATFLPARSVTTHVLTGIVPTAPVGMQNHVQQQSP